MDNNFDVEKFKSLSEADRVRFIINSGARRSSEIKKFVDDLSTKEEVEDGLE